ncbi:MAG: hypothetical protein JW709_12160 [Sedimentisphaerales bacterium]|nr:hypothetical protein [Sedimentisphaerales bacterium]
MSKEKEPITLRKFIRTVFRRWRLVVASAVLFAILAMLCSRFLSLQYTATTIFERRKDPAAAQTSLRGSDIYKASKLTQEFELSGQDAVLKAIDQLGWTEGLPREKESGEWTEEGQRLRQQKATAVSEAIEVKWEVQSDEVDLVKISFTDSDPDKAEQMANILVENYINRVSEQTVEQLKDSYDFLDQQVQNSNSQLFEIINERINFETEKSGVLPESPGALREAMLKVAADYDQLQLQYEAAQQQLARLDAMAPPEVVEEGEDGKPREIVKGPNPDYTDLQKQLRQTQSQLDELTEIRTMTDAHPTVKILKRKIEQLEQDLAETEPTTVLNEVFGARGQISQLELERLGLKVQTEVAKNRLERLDRQRELYEDLMANFGPARREYLELIKKMSDKERELNDWETRRTAVQMNLAAEAAKRRMHLNAVQAALKPDLPSSPSLITIFGFAIIGGIIFGGGLVFLASWADQTVSTPEEAAKGFGIPVFGYVDVIVTPQKGFLRKFRRWILTPLVVVILTIGLALSALDVTLRLRQPESYKEWKAEPIAYLSQQAEILWDRVREIADQVF